MPITEKAEQVTAMPETADEKIVVPKVLEHKASDTIGASFFSVLSHQP